MNTSAATASERSAQVIAVANQKGGCGKTASAVNLAAWFARQGRRVLLVDLDAQANATRQLLGDYGAEGRTGYDVLMRQADVNDCIAQTEAGFDLLPSGLAMEKANFALHHATRGDERLAGVIRQIQSRYDLVFVDTPPNLGKCTLNALVGAHFVLIPMDPGAEAFEGISVLLSQVADIEAEYEKSIRCFLLPTFVDNTGFTKELVDKAREEFTRGAVLASVRRNVRIREAVAARMTIFDYDLAAIGALDYGRVAEELRDGIEA